jgi:hypothetical protein
VDGIGGDMIRQVSIILDYLRTVFCTRAVRPKVQVVGKLGHWEPQTSRPQILPSTAELAAVRVQSTSVVLHHCYHPPILRPLVRAQASLSFSNPIPSPLTGSSPYLRTTVKGTGPPLF